MHRIWALALGLTAAGVAPALAAGDPAAGEQVFRRCQACHLVTAEQNRVGPHLVGVFGRPAGAVEGFNYSPAMRQAGEDGLVWDEETIAAYLADPRGYIQGNRMAFAGLRQEQEIADVIAYMRQFE
jgi:cytochrome c